MPGPDGRHVRAPVRHAHRGRRMNKVRAVTAAALEFLARIPPAGARHLGLSGAGTGQAASRLAARLGQRPAARAGIGCFRSLRRRHCGPNRAFVLGVSTS